MNLTRLPFLLCVMCGFFYGGLASDRAQADNSNWCTPNTVPEVNIHTSTNDITYDFSKSKKQLDQFSTDTINPYGPEVITDVGGLMKGGIQAAQKMKFGTVTNQRTREICYWYNTIDVNIHIKPTIYIANDYPRGSCMHKAIMAHEEKHIIVDREIVNKYALLVGEALKKEMTTARIYGPVHVTQGAAIESQIKTRMQTILKYYTDQMSAERRSRQQQVDSLSEYERVNNLCKK